jgi:hypothetical protein
VRPLTPIPITPHVEVIFNPEKFEDNFYLQIKCEKKERRIILNLEQAIHLKNNLIKNINGI